MIRLLVFGALWVCGVLTLPGCAHVISEDSRKLVASPVRFEDLRKDPDSYIGRYVLLGGVIAGVKNNRDGGQLEVVQFPLDQGGLPESFSGSDGRFLATAPVFLDEYVYRRGRLITVVGEVKGKKVLPLDEVTYRYPVISIRERYLWEEYDAKAPFPYPPPLPFYEPYYWGYWPDAYSLRPYGPVQREYR